MTDTPLTDEAMSIADNFGPIFGTDDAVTAQEAHDQCFAALERLARTLERQLAAATARAEAAEKDADAATLYGKTAMAHGYSSSPPWSELAEETRQMYRNHLAAQGSKP